MRVYSPLVELSALVDEVVPKIESAMPGMR